MKTSHLRLSVLLFCFCILMYSALCWCSWSILGWVLCRVTVIDLSAFFCTQPSGLTSTTCWTCCLFFFFFLEKSGSSLIFENVFPLSLVFHFFWFHVSLSLYYTPLFICIHSWVVGNLKLMWLKSLWASLCNSCIE